MFQGKSKFQGNFSSVVEHFQDIKYDQTCVNDSEIYFVTIACIINILDLVPSTYLACWLLEAGNIEHVTSYSCGYE